MMYVPDACWLNWLRGACVFVARGSGSFVWSHMCGGTMRASTEGPQVQRIRLYLTNRTKSSTSSGSNMELAGVCQPLHPVAFAAVAQPQPATTSAVIQ